MIDALRSNAPRGSSAAAPCLSKVVVVVSRRRFRRVSSTGLRLGRAVALTGALLGAGAGVLAGCGVDNADVELDVAVLPRVLLDGTIELSDRSGGRVLIEDVVAHAPRARLQSVVAGDEGDVVVDERDPLVFHYELAARTGFGDADGERVWSMPASGGLLSVDFAPWRAGEGDADVDGLRGHTAVVRGSIAIDTREPLASGFGDAGGGDGAVSDADPDGAPAQPGDVGDADPDGAPAQPGETSEADGSVCDADPDGAPAHPVDDVADADPDGAPAHPVDDVADADVSDADVSDADPDGAPAHPVDDVADADPDGAPAHPGEGVADADVADADPDGAPARPTTSKKMTAEGFRRSVVRVPFTLVLDGAFERSVVLEGDDVVGVGANEVLPIDLHLAAGELLDGDGLKTLEGLAATALAHGDPEATMHFSARTTAAVVGVEVKATMSRPRRPIHAGGSRIDVSGSRLRQK